MVLSFLHWFSGFILDKGHDPNFNSISDLWVLPFCFLKIQESLETGCQLLQKKSICKNFEIILLHWAGQTTEQFWVEFSSGASDCFGLQRDWRSNNMSETVVGFACRLVWCLCVLLVVAVLPAPYLWLCKRKSAV